MFSPALSLTIATTLAFHPFAVGRHATNIAPTTVAPTSSPAPTTGSGSTTTAPGSTTTAPGTTAPPADAQPGWDDEPIAEPTSTAPASPPEPPKAAAVESKPAGPTHEVVRPKTHSGIGLMVGAGAAGATAWGLTIGKIVLAERCNDSIQEGGTVEDAQVTVFQCFKNIKSILGLSIAGWFANWATWGLAAGAGGVRGKHDGVRFAWEGRPDRVAGGFIGGGAAMLGVGVVGIGVSRVLALTKILQCDVNADINNCVTRGFRGYFAGLQVSSSLVAAGLGLMVYGIVYRKNRQMFKDRSRVATLQIVPDNSLFPRSGYDYNGLALTGKF